jgi:ketosteroid isomerase-like protein
MSEADVEVVRRSYEAFACGDTAAALAAYSEDTEWDDTRFRPEGRVHRGRDELVELVRAWVGTWRDYSMSLERVVDAGDHVVVISEEHGIGKGSGIEVNTRLGALVDVDGGQITRTVIYASPEDALEAAGLHK